MRSIFSHLFRDYFGRGNPFLRNFSHTSSQADVQNPSFSQLLPWLDIDEKGHVLLEDAKSIAAVIELYPQSAESESSAFLDELHIALERMLTETFPGTDDFPWVMQVYSFIDRNVLIDDWEKSIAQCAPGTAECSGSKSMRTIFDKHIENLATTERAFSDPMDGGRPWRGNRQRVICCIYRYHPHANIQQHLKELERQLKRLYDQLDVAHIVYRTLNDVEIYKWLKSWFDPCADKSSADDLTEQKKSFDYTMSDAVCPRTVRSNDKTGVWFFDKRMARVISMQRLRMPPEIGGLSLGCESKGKISSFIEQIPPHSMVMMTLVFTSSEWISEHLDRIDNHAVGKNISASSSRAATEQARYHVLHGGKFYPFFMAVYLNASSEEQLTSQSEQVDALCLAHNIQMLKQEHDPVALDSYVRHLPMAYRYSLEQIKYRNRIIYVKDAASLLPLYGRAVGSQRLGLTFFNRGGGLFSYNPLDLQDRVKNAHLFLFGPTGAGKSAMLTYLQMLLMAFHRPRIIVVESGNSYGLLTQYFISRGLAVQDEVLRPGCNTRLSPFTKAHYLHTAKTGDQHSQSERDWLGEMTLTARLMVTGGHRKEEERFSRADEATLARAIMAATESCGATTRVSDVLLALRAQVNTQDAGRRARIHEMSEALELFTMGFAGELFNTAAAEWEIGDYVRMELGTLASGENKDMLSVAWLSLMNATIAFAERNQQDGRPIILLTDEAHMISCNPLLASYMVKISKLLGRRLGLWLWMATQNMSDFPGEAQKMLGMFEWWLALGLSHSEIEELCHYKPLTSNVFNMLSMTRKVPGKYIEGVLMGDKIAERFRHVPPPLCLALAQTEKEEKTHRAKLMRSHGCSELDAAFKVAEEISASLCK